MPRKRRSSPHGPVRRITDPEELARFAEKYRTSGQSKGQIPCKGNKITVSVGKQEREVTDQYLAQLLDEDAARPAEQKLSRKRRSSLADFRRKLSEDGAEAFTNSQKEYLGSLIERVEDPQKGRITQEEREKRNRQIKAFFAFLDRKEKGQAGRESIIADLFSPAVLRSVIDEVSRVLRPYGLEGEAESFVIRFGLGVLTNIESTVVDMPVPPRGLRRFLFGHILNPDSPRYFGLKPREIPEKLRKELDGVLPEATEVVRERVNSMVHAASGRVSIAHLNAGAPGSGKGGSPVK